MMTEYPFVHSGIPAVPHWDADHKNQVRHSTSSAGGSKSTAAAPAPAAPAQQGPGAADWMLAVLEAQQQARDAAYNAAAEAQRRSYRFAKGQLNDGTARALQEAYINKMLTLKSLPQQLSVQGLSGGESETTAAGVYNNYGNARNALEVERARQMGELLNLFQSNMAKLEAQRAGGVTADLAKLVPQLTRLTAGNKPLTVTVAQGQTPADAAGAAMRRLRRALGLEEEE